MRTNTIAACLALGGAALLGACSKHDDASTSASTTSATTTATASAPAASAMPKAGLWEMTVTGTGLPTPVKTKACLGGVPPPGANPFTPPAQPGQTCAKNSVLRTANGYAIDTECTINGMTMSTKGDVTGDFSSNYKTVMTTTMTGANVPAMMQTPRTSTAEAKYLGACPADMKPGMAAQGA